VSYPPPSSAYPGYPPPEPGAAPFAPPTGRRLTGPPAEQLGAVSSVIGVPTRATIPLNKLAPEAALRRLELTIVRRLEGYLQGDHLGLLPGPGTDANDARLYRQGEDDVRRIDWAVTARTTVSWRSGGCSTSPRR